MASDPSHHDPASVRSRRPVILLQSSGVHTGCASGPFQEGSESSCQWQWAASGVASCASGGARGTDSRPDRPNRLILKFLLTEAAAAASNGRLELEVITDGMHLAATGTGTWSLRSATAGHRRRVRVRRSPSRVERYSHIGTGTVRSQAGNHDASARATSLWTASESSIYRPRRLGIMLCPV